MLELLYTSPRKPFEGWDSSKDLGRFAFHKEWDAMILSGGTRWVNNVEGTFKIFKDGHACQFLDKARAGYSSIIEMNGGNLCVRLSPTMGTYQFHELDPFTAVPLSIPFFSYSGSLSADGLFVDKERALILGIYGRVLNIYSMTDPPVLLNTLTVSNISNDNFYAIHGVSDGKVMLSKTRVSGVTNTKLIFVNYVERSILLTTQLNPYRAACFDSHCGVVFAINASGYTEIYYPVAIPSHLTTPVLDPAVVGLYGGNFVTTQVLGDLNEPCPDRVVHWYLVNGIGALEKEKTKSDSDGIASNYYFATDNPVQVGLEETILVETLI